jgi:uncharacterized membrane protein
MARQRGRPPQSDGGGRHGNKVVATTASGRQATGATQPKPLPATPSPEAAQAAREVAPSRLVSLSDALFATVLTVLVLDLRLPVLPDVPSAAQLREAMGELWPHFFGYVLTFVVAGLYWRAHHRVFDLVVRVDRRLMWYNLMFLICVGLLPFTTSALSANGPGPAFWSLYAIDMAGIGLMLTVTWGYAVTHGLAGADVTPRLSRLLVLANLVTPVAFLLSIVAMALTLRPYAAQALLLVIPVANQGLERAAGIHGEKRQPDGQRVAGALWLIAALLPLLAFAAWSVWLLAIWKP